MASEIDEIRADLFSDRDVADGEAIIVHCISSCKRLGAGFALAVRRRYGKPEGDTADWPCHILQAGADGNYIGHLVTKCMYWHKPTIATLQVSLDGLCAAIAADPTLRGRCLVMPRIGCGLDRLRWGDVQKIVAETMARYGLSGRVYCL